MLTPVFHTSPCFNFTAYLIYNLDHPLPYHTRNHKLITVSSLNSNQQRNRYDLFPHRSDDEQR